MLEKVKDTIQSYNMIKKGERVIVALSGGKDSVSLLFCLNELSKELDIKLEACHINHMLRGKDSDSDEMFVISLCEKLGIRLHRRSYDVNALLQKHESVEERARACRYDFFFELTRDNNAKIATAHTATDNTETVLINLLRGSALKGLCGIPPVRGEIIRPLILCKTEEITDFCSENNLQFVTDVTNFSDEYTRNNIRLNILPQLIKINPSLVNTLTRTSTLLREDEEYFAEIVKIEMQKARKDDGYDIFSLINLPHPILSRIIYNILSKNNISPTSLQISRVEEIIKNGINVRQKINLKKHMFAVVDKNVLYVKKIHQTYRKKT